MNTDSTCYFAKATKPALEWKTAPTTRAKAHEAAQQYVNDWSANGLKVEAGVFFRDGSIVETITQPFYA